MKTKILLSGAMLATAAIASAQYTNSGYFLDNYNYRYQLNPAFGNEKHFVSMPLLGNLNMALQGTLNLKDFVYNVDGKTVLFTNPAISNSFLGNLSDPSRLSTDMKIDIMSAGFKAFGGYNTITIGARMGVVGNVPRTFFDLAKNGVSNRTYDVSNMSFQAYGFGEVALNHSRDIKEIPGLRVGAAIKFLLGLANIEANFNKADLTLASDKWFAETDADVYANIGGFQYETDLRDDGTPYVSGANMDGDGSIGINGFGMAFDLGASYQWKDFNFSLAVLDLGWLSYYNTQHASTNGTRTISTDAYTFNANEDEYNSFDNEMDVVTADLDKLYQLDNNGNIGTRNVSLGATLNIGVDYALPVYRNLHFGLLSSSRLMKNNTWTEVRVSANVAPVKWFSADVNFVGGTYGCGFGWLLNFYHTGINFFLGMDRTIGALCKQGIPLNSNASFNMGINFPF